MEEKTKYNDTDLLEFKEIIVEKLTKSKDNYNMYKNILTHSDENSINDTSPTFKVLEEGYQVLSKEENSRLASRQQKFINNLENALLRIENQTYGICRVTGKLISKERLKSVPHATLSIEAKLKQS